MAILSHSPMVERLGGEDQWRGGRTGRQGMRAHIRLEHEVRQMLRILQDVVLRNLSVVRRDTVGTRFVAGRDVGLGHDRGGVG